MFPPIQRQRLFIHISCLFPVNRDVTTVGVVMPPYSVAETVAYLQEHQISVLISKDSGARGGVPEKIQAAKQVGIPVLLIQSPEQIER